MSSEPVEVVIATSLTDDLIERIEKVDARVHVADAAARLFEELPSALRPGQEPAPDRSGGHSLDALLSRAEVVLAARRLPADIGRRAPNLRWIQLPLAGSEWARGIDVWRDPNVAITSGAGISAGPVAEWVVTQMLTLAKQVGRMVRGQRARQWDRFDLAQLRGATIGIVGFGAIGRETARLAAAFGMRVLAVKRNLADAGLVGAEVELLPPSALDRVLREADFLVLAAPSTPETRGMIGARELGLMKPTAYFINPARGDLVDEPALLAALAEAAHRGRRPRCPPKRAAPGRQPLVGGRQRPGHRPRRGPVRGLRRRRRRSLPRQPWAVPCGRAAAQRRGSRAGVLGLAGRGSSVASD